MLDLLFGSSKRADASEYGWRGWWHGGYRRKTVAGPVIDEEKALTYAAVMCATRIIAEGSAALPLPLYRRIEDGGREQAYDHPSYQLLKLSPNPRMGATAFREGRTAHQVNWGNGFAEIDRRRDGRPAALWPIHACRVQPNIYSDSSDDYPYLVRNNDGSRVPMKADEILHLPGVISEDGIWGKGIITYARESIGFGLSVDRHGGAYFGSGAQPKGVLTVPGMKDREARSGFREEWKEVHGSPDSGEIAILPPEAKFQPITLSNEDSQFLETRKLNVTEIARWYRVPPHMLADLERATFANIEHLSLEFVIYCLMPWLRRWEDECNRKLLLPEEQGEYFFEHQLAGLLRGDVKSRMEAYQTALLNGVMTINEVRRLENLNSIGPAGDQNFVQLNMTTAERMLAGIPAKPSPADQQALFDEWTRTAIAQSHSHDMPKRKGGKAKRLRAAAREAAEAVLSDALGRMFAKEANAVKRFASDANFEEELAAFHEKHLGTCCEALAAGVRSLAVCGIDRELTMLSCEIIAHSAGELTAAYNSDDREQFAARLKDWAEYRVGQELCAIFTPEEEVKT